MKFEDGQITVDDKVVLDGVRRSEHRGILAWVRSRVALSESAETIQGLLEGTSSGTSSPPLHLLEGSVKAIKTALATGNHDGHVAALLEAEAAGKNRKGVLAALSSRAG